MTTGDMVRRSPPKNEAQDPTLPHKKRARWRVIGAAVLAMAAVVILPLALESEPKRPLAKVEIRIPQRAYLEHGNRTWLDTASRDAPPAEIIAASGDIVPPVSPGLVVSEDAGPVPPAESEPAPAVQAPAPVAAPPVIRVDVDSKGKAAAPGSESTRSGKAAAPEKAAASKAATKEAAKPEPKATAKANSGNQEAAAKASKLAKTAPAADAAPPMPKRRTDRADLQSASPSGYVVQIGAFSSPKGARTLVARARELGFEAYTETLKTKQGDRIRVRVGPYLTREQADVARSKLRNRGVDSVLIAP
ncbi:MAG: SPOR domain-containing protein [Burkholderiaceae bacterium]